MYKNCKRPLLGQNRFSNWKSPLRIQLLLREASTFGILLTMAFCAYTGLQKHHTGTSQPFPLLGVQSKVSILHNHAKFLPNSNYCQLHTSMSGSPSLGNRGMVYPLSINRVFTDKYLCQLGLSTFLCIAKIYRTPRWLPLLRLSPPVVVESLLCLDPSSPPLALKLQAPINATVFISTDNLFFSLRKVYLV